MNWYLNIHSDSQGLSKRKEGLTLEVYGNIMIELKERWY